MRIQYAHPRIFRLIAFPGTNETGHARGKSPAERMTEPASSSQFRFWTLEIKKEGGGERGEYKKKKNEIVEKSRDKISTSFDLLNGRENIGKRNFSTSFPAKVVNLKRNVKRMERALSPRYNSL